MAIVHRKPEVKFTCPKFTNTPVWSPNLEDIFVMAAKDIEELRLQNIVGNVNVHEISEIESMSFVFSNGTMAPPEGTYPWCPTRPLMIPQNKQIAEVIFLTKFSRLFGIEFRSDNNEILVSMVSHIMEDFDFNSIKLEKEEKILSA